MVYGEVPVCNNNNNNNVNTRRGSAQNLQLEALLGIYLGAKGGYLESNKQELALSRRRRRYV